MSQEATSAFLRAATQTPPDLNALRAAVRAGADVTAELRARDDGAGRPYLFDYDAAPALSLLIRRGELQAVLACLESPKAIDFTRRCDDLDCNRTPLHEVAVANTVGWPDYNREVLEAVVHRLASHSGDVVDWSLECEPAAFMPSCDFASLAAHHQLLSVVWPVLGIRVAHYANRVEPLLLTAEVWSADWEALAPQEQRRFRMAKTALFRCSDYGTGRLWMACRQFPQPNYLVMRACVTSGADVLFPTEVFETPILSHVLLHGPVKAVRVLLETPSPLDFTVADRNGYTPLHCVPWGWNGATAGKKTFGEVSELLRLILGHIEQHPQDKVDWGRKDSGGDDPIAVAAIFGRLTSFVEVLFHERPVPYFIERIHKIKITCEARRADVCCLRPEDLQRFDFVCGIADGEINEESVGSAGG